MDIRFLKNLSPNVGYLFPKSRIHLTPTPAIDIVNIGVSQAIRNHAIYVPIYGQHSTYQETKIISQVGGSIEKIPLNSKSKNPPKNDTKEISEIETTSFNSLKHKLDDGIQSSFMYPKIKTSSLKLSLKSAPKKAKTGYKFSVAD